MPKEIDALVIIGYCWMLTDEIPHYIREDTESDLEFVRSGETTWPDNTPITKEAKDALFASEVFLQLGNLAVSVYTQKLPKKPQEANPYREDALNVLSRISPFETGEVLLEELAVRWPNMNLNQEELPRMFDAALTARSSIAAELGEKWGMAQAVYEKRGKAVIMAYTISTLAEGFSGLRLDEIAPDEVSFDSNLNIEGLAYNLGELIDRTSVQAKPTEVPYYQSFSLSEGNAQAMLKSALEDLELIGQSLREK